MSRYTRLQRPDGLRPDRLRRVVPDINDLGLPAGRTSRRCWRVRTLKCRPRPGRPMADCRHRQPARPLRRHRQRAAAPPSSRWWQQPRHRRRASAAQPEPRKVKAPTAHSGRWIPLHGGAGVPPGNVQPHGLPLRNPMKFLIAAATATFWPWAAAAPTDQRPDRHWCGRR